MRCGASEAKTERLGLALPKDLIVQRAREALAAERQLEAINILRQAIDDTNDGELLVELGYAYLDAEQYAAALEAFDRAGAADMESAGVLAGKAAAYEGMGQWEEAGLFLRRAIELSPSSARYTVLGHIQTVQKDLAHARSSFEKALELDPNNDEALLNLALLIKEQNPVEAETMLVEAMRIEPASAAAHRELAFLLLGRDDVAGAEQLLNKSIELDPADTWARIYLGNLMFRRGAYGLASASFRVAAEQEPLWSLPRRLNGDVLSKAPELGDAATEYRAAVHADGTDAVAALKLGCHLVRTGLFDEGRQWIERARSISPDIVLPQDVRRLLRGAR